jgi:hypothetical protein
MVETTVTQRETVVSGSDGSARASPIGGYKDGSSKTLPDCACSRARRIRLWLGHEVCRHNDTSWPNTQEFLRAQLAGMSSEDVARIIWQNASELYRHPVP